jgi:DNA-binding beta-propeller fold protein YncE
VAAGEFPRDLTASPDGRTVYVSNYDSGNVESVDLSGIAAT